MTDVLDRLKKALADRYAIESEIGSGGMATGYLAEDLGNERRVTLKTLRRCAVALVLAASSANAISAQDAVERQLDVSLLFHFNQDLVPSAGMASQVAYKGLLETLRKHPGTPVQIQISGTLLNALAWMDPRAIELVREGFQSGQFEILGSTYSQNVMYASGDSWTNSLQIETHRQLLKQHFDVEPVGFWNPERVWTQSFVDLLAQNGYEYTFVEGHILEDSDPQRPLHVTRSTSSGDSELTIIHDDQTIIGLFDGARDSGNPDSLLTYLRGLYEADTEDRFLVAYCQDAEASGLWQFEQGTDPAAIFANLDTLLTVLENTDWLNVTTGRRFLSENQPAEELSPIVDGQATWMIQFANALGFEDWYEYWMTDSLQALFRPLLQEVRDSLRAVDRDLAALGRPSAASALFDRAVRTFLAHEYEFGASWFWTPTWSDFMLSSETYVSLLAVRHALSPGEAFYTADVNRDGVEEALVAGETDLFVFSPHGGRLLYWFDLEHGESLVGNENASHYVEEYVDGNRYLPQLHGARDVYPWHEARGHHPDIRDRTYQLRRRALNDWLYDGGVLVDSLVFETYDFAFEYGSLTFRHDAGALELTKRIETAADSGMNIEYTILNRSPTDKAVTFMVESGFSPSYVNAMDHGRAALWYWDGEPQEYLSPYSTVGVINRNTGVIVHYVFHDRPFYVEGDEGLFGIELNPRFLFRLEPRGEKVIRFGLRRRRAEQP